MKTLFLTSILAFLSLPMSAQWNPMTETSGVYVSKCSFPTDEIGYVIGNYSLTGAYAILKTTDGGQTWNEIFTQGPLGEMLFDLDFVSADEGFMSLRLNVGPTLLSKVWHTTDGGQSWDDASPLNADPGFGNAAIAALQGGHVFQGSSTNLNSSHNNGSDWSETVTEEYDSPFSISAASAQRAAAGMWDGSFAYAGSIYHTNDGGETWNKLDIEKAYSQIKAILTPDDQTIVGVSQGSGWNGGYPSVYLTTDGAATWDTLHVNLLAEHTVTDMVMLHDTIYISSNTLPGVIQTADMAQNFSPEWESAHAINCMCAAQNAIYAFGDMGQVNKKTSVAPGVSEESPIKFNLFPNPASEVLNISFAQTTTHPATITAVDITGREVARQTVAMGMRSAELDIRDLPAGVFVLRVSGIEVTQNTIGAVRKFVVE